MVQCGALDGNLPIRASATTAVRALARHELSCNVAVQRATPQRAPARLTRHLLAEVDTPLKHERDTWQSLRFRGLPPFQRQLRLDALHLRRGRDAPNFSHPELARRAFIGQRRVMTTRHNYPENVNRAVPVQTPPVPNA